jgi:hypothetical protein
MLSDRSSGRRRRCGCLSGLVLMLHLAVGVSALEGSSSSVVAVEILRVRSGDWEQLDFVARATPGFPVTEIRVGAAGAPVTDFVVEARPLQGASLGTAVELGNLHRFQRQAAVPEGYVITGVAIRREGGAVQSLALESAPLPAGVQLGEAQRFGDEGFHPDVASRVPEGHYLIGIGGTDGKNNLRHFGITARRLAVEEFEPTPAPSGYRTIYVSAVSGDDARDGSTPGLAVRTVYRAKEIAQDHPEASGFRILLRGGETFTPDRPMRNAAMDRRNEARGRYALMWDLPQGLILSTYGSGEMAVFGPGGYTMNPADVPGAICVVTPCRHPVLIENIHFKRWQMEVLYTLSYLPREKDRLVFRNNLVEEHGTLYFPGETSMEGNLPFYTGGTLQPRSSRGFVVENNIFRDIHNHIFDKDDARLLDKMHVVYLGSTGDTEIRGNVIQNTSGPPFKVRYRAARNILLLDNAFYYAAPSEQLNLVQLGWYRVSGGREGTDDWPENILIAENFFYYPYAWEGIENPVTATARKYSVSKVGQELIGTTWRNNRFILEWE